MNSQIFEEWVRELHVKFDKEQRKVTLIVDNCSAYPEIGGIKSVQIFLFFNFLIQRLLYNPWIIGLLDL